MSARSYDPLDGALDRLAGYGPDLANGNFSHAPMVAEALCALGRPEAVMPWIERYRERIVARAPGGRTRPRRRPTDPSCRVARRAWPARPLCRLERVVRWGTARQPMAGGARS